MRLLFVAMPNSMHTTRWINQLAGRGWDLHLFSAYEAGPLPELKGTTVHSITSCKAPGLDPSVLVCGLWPFPRGASFLRRIVEKVAPRWIEAKTRLARLIHRIRPDIVHSLEFQQAGYLTLETRKEFDGSFPPWIASNWGSDIFLFGRLAEHAPKIRELLATCDHYACECERDIALAREFGFRGECLPVVPAAGGFDVPRLRTLRSSVPASARRVIHLKGYQSQFGRALTGLRAVEKCADALAGYRVLLTGASPDVRVAAELVARSTGIAIECAGRTSYDEALRRLGMARISIGLSISDGIPTSLLETMLMGAFPVQSPTGCCTEWVRDGETALFAHPDDPDAVAAALRRALSDDVLVDRGIAANMAVAEARASLDVVRPKVVAAYERIVRRQT